MKLINYAHKFKVGDIVRVITTGPGSGHQLQKGELVKIIKIESGEAFIVQASSQKAFRSSGGWSRLGLGDWLQHMYDDDVEFAFSVPNPEIALSDKALPLI